MQNDLLAAHAALDTIQSTVKKYPGGSQCEVALKAIRKAVGDFQMVHDTAGYVGEKLLAILPTGEILYSARKHRGDPARVRIQFLTYLSNVRNAIEPPPKAN